MTACGRGPRREKASRFAASEPDGKRAKGTQADEASAGQSAEREILFFSGLPRPRGLPAFGLPANGSLATQWLAVFPLRVAFLKHRQNLLLKTNIKWAQMLATG
jgi:hypothetical protein